MIPEYEIRIREEMPEEYYQLMAKHHWAIEWRDKRIKELEEQLITMEEYAASMEDNQ